MAEAALTFLLNNVQKLLMEQLNLIAGAEKEVNLLKRDLKLMIAVLEESAEKGEKGKVFLELEKQIREAVYDAEDALDAWLTQKSGKASGILSRPKTIDLAKKVKELRLNDLKPLFDQATQSLTAMPKQHASGADPGTAGVKLEKIQLLREDNVVGFVDEEATLIKYINSKTEHLDVISIVGMPGLGKTTLAWKIYRNLEIEFDFPVLIWVYVSQDFNMREVCLTILKKFTNDGDIPKLDLQALIRKVRSYLEKGKFLLFLDDVWTFENWTVISYVLPRNNKLGKVLITSRHAGVAAQANCNRVPHQLRFLNLDESWELLQLEVFGKNNGCPEELKGLGMEIADKCGGVPLAVVVIGGILVEKSVNRTDSWKKVSKSVSEYLIMDDKQKRTENIILLSYNKLPYELRDCFLYIGVFPEDTEIPVWKLIRLWIAEGFIQEQENQRQSLEEVAEDNLNELVARNLVRIDKTKANGDIKTCRVHDMIREFCQNEAAFANKNLYQEVRMVSVREFRPDISDIEKRRRLCIHSNVLEFIEQKPKGPKVRSFLCFSKDTINLPAEYTPLIPESFNLLRVIDVNPIKFAKFPSKLNKLIHLRYLTMSGNNFTALPDAVSGLWNLQTVMIQTTSRELEIKADIGKMKQLRHFKTKAAIVLSKEGKGEGGEKLQTLSRLSAKCCTKGVLSRASNLKNLGIRGNIALLHDSNCLAKLEHLEKLKLVHDTFPHQPSENALSSLPPTHNFPPKLRILTLSSTYLDWTEMDRVGSLCHLAVLKLKENAFKGSSWKSESHKFPCLESLHITRTDLMTWTASDNTFPKLKTLILKNCERLQEIPSQLGKALQLVEIERVTTTLVESARAIQTKKQQMQGQEGGIRDRFKLKISPGDALATTSSIPN